MSRRLCSPYDHTDAMLAAALGYAGRGVYVFPIAPDTKLPLVAWVNGREPATTDPGLIVEWFGRRFRGANIGAACGPSGLVVIDIDGQTGERSWNSLTTRYGDTPTTTVTTGRPDGGRHLWYRALPNVEVRNSHGTASRGLAPDIDIRGAGGMVLCPPSVHPSGRRYRWANRLPLAPLPAWVPELLSQRQQQANHPVASPGGAFTPPAGRARDERWAAACLAESARDIAGMPPDSGRNSALNGAAYKAGRLVAGGLLDESDVVRALTDAAAACGLPVSEAARTIRSGMSGGMRSPRTRGAA